MNALAAAPPETTTRPMLELGTIGSIHPLMLDLEKLMSGRLLIQGSSGAGKSRTIRRLVEEAFEYLTNIIVDPEGEFASLAVHIGATTIMASDLSPDGLTDLALRSRANRLPLHIDLSDLEPDERILRAAAFFAGLLNAPKEHWANTCLVTIDEAHLLAPHIAASARDAETRRLGIAAMAELCTRGRKRGIATVIATPRLAMLASSITSTLQNLMIGMNVFDRDLHRAAGMLGLSAADGDRLRSLLPGEFFVFGPALKPRPIIAKVGESITVHDGQTPEMLGPIDVGTDEANARLGLVQLREQGAASRHAAPAQRSNRALEHFLMDPASATAARVVEALRRIAPNATTSAELVKHLGCVPDQVDAALDLLAGVHAIDSAPRGETRLCRLGAKLRILNHETQVVGLA